MVFGLLYCLGLAGILAITLALGSLIFNIVYRICPRFRRWFKELCKEVIQ